MHDAALAARIKQCFPFMLHWPCIRGREGFEGGSDRSPLSALMGLMTLMAAALNKNVMIPLSFRGAKLTL